MAPGKSLYLRKIILPRGVDSTSPEISGRKVFPLVMALDILNPS